MRKERVSLPKQHALPLQEQCASVASKEAVSTTASVPPPEAAIKAEGDASYLALAIEVRNDIVAFVREVDEGGGLECLINCDDYGDVVLTHHLHRIHKCLGLAEASAKTAVEILETRAIPFRLTDKTPE